MSRSRRWFLGLVPLLLVPAALAAPQRANDSCGQTLDACVLTAHRAEVASLLVIPDSSTGWGTRRCGKYSVCSPWDFGGHVPQTFTLNLPFWNYSPAPKIGALALDGNPWMTDLMADQKWGQDITLLLTTLVDSNTAGTLFSIPTLSPFSGDIRPGFSLSVTNGSLQFNRRATDGYDSYDRPWDLDTDTLLHGIPSSSTHSYSGLADIFLRFRKDGKLRIDVFLYSGTDKETWIAHTVDMGSPVRAYPPQEPGTLKTWAAAKYYPIYVEGLILGDFANKAADRPNLVRLVHFDRLLSDNELIAYHVETLVPRKDFSYGMSLGQLPCNSGEYLHSGVRISTPCAHAEFMHQQ